LLKFELNPFFNDKEVFMFRFTLVVFMGLLLLGGCNSGLKEELELKNSQVERLNTEKNDLSAKLTNAQKRIAELEATPADEQPTEGDIAMRDGLAEGLSKELKAGHVVIDTESRRTYIRFNDEVLFGSGSAAPRPKGIEALSSLAKELKKITGYQLVIEGYADKMPIGQRLRTRFATNQELAAARSLAVTYFLESEMKVKMPVVVVSYGHYYEAASNKTPKGRAQNRRVVLILAPEGSKPL